MIERIRPKILIVEDVSVDVDLLTRILKDDYTIYVAKNGKAALRTANESKPDLIILDIILPDESGFDILARLKEANETREIPVIIITGLSNAQFEEKGLSLGAVDYITKPFHSTVVRARIGMHVQILHYVRTIEQLGLTDTLTVLPNRRSFDNQIRIEWARAVREKNELSLLIFDLDRFRDYNERYGRPQGDQLLMSVARTVSESLKRPADMAARLEDDRFAVLLPNTDSKGAAILAEEIRERLAFLSVDGTAPVTVSVGSSSQTPTTDDSLDAFIFTAGEKCDAAKESGGNRVVD